MAALKGQKKTGGRQKGALNKATAGLKAAFQMHETEFVKIVLKLSKSLDERVSLEATKVAMDRGWGKAPQTLAVDVDVSLKGLMERIDGRSRGILTED